MLIVISKTTVWIFQAIKKRNLPLEDLDIDNKNNI